MDGRCNNGKMKGSKKAWHKFLLEMGIESYL